MTTKTENNQAMATIAPLPSNSILIHHFINPSNPSLLPLQLVCFLPLHLPVIPRFFLALNFHEHVFTFTLYERVLTFAFHDCVFSFTLGPFLRGPSSDIPTIQNYRSRIGVCSVHHRADVGRGAGLKEKVTGV
jgi:hypothetical protein